MPRIRSVKPETATSEVVAAWPREVRYAWVLLWTILDDEGRGLDAPKAIAGALFPHDDDVTPRKMGNWLAKMASPSGPSAKSPLCRYTVSGRNYLHAVNWDEHQRPNRPSPSRFPRCPTHEPLTEPLSEPPPEASHGDSMPGSSKQEVGTRNQEQQRPRSERGDRHAAAAALIAKHTDATLDDGLALAEWIDREKKPRNLNAFIAALAKGPDLNQLLEDHRTRIGKHGIAAEIALARKGPACKHREHGGAYIHPTTGKPLCPLCRKEAEHNA
jgi:hypothetical protein